MLDHNFYDSNLATYSEGRLRGRTIIIERPMVIHDRWEVSPQWNKVSHQLQRTQLKQTIELRIRAPLLSGLAVIDQARGLVGNRHAYVKIS